MSEAWAVPLGLLVLGGCVSIAGWLASRVSAHGERIAALTSEVEALDGTVQRVERKLDALIERS